MRHSLFPDIEVPDYLLSLGFTLKDVYGNDTAVRLTRLNVSLWVDHVDPAQRETMGPRFGIHTHNEELEPTSHYASFEDEKSLNAYLESLRIM